MVAKTSWSPAHHGPATLAGLDGEEVYVDKSLAKCSDPFD